MVNAKGYHLALGGTSEYSRAKSQQYKVDSNFVQSEYVYLTEEPTNIQEAIKPALNVIWNSANSSL